MDKKVKVTAATAMCTFIAVLCGTNPEETIKFMGEAVSSQVAQSGFFFTLAAWLHAGRVKKEISEQFSILTAALNNVAAALKQDLAIHSGRLDNVESGIKIINERVTALETKGDEWDYEKNTATK